jgi:hypothetical protein
MTRALWTRLRSDDGYTVAELAVVALVAGLALTILAIFLVASLRTGVFTEGQSATINDARNALHRLEKELRGADSITWCGPVGNCLEVGAQTVDGGFRTVRYTLDSAQLKRREFDAQTSTWGLDEAIVDRVENTGAQPIFGCDTQSTLLRVNVDLYIQPTPQSDPSYNLHTSVRPRNFPSKATCPS